uniref:Myb-like domain-containing protein n=1 Tax=Brassica oleracea var. oleracea TaxID=109376 RepID=A0A0D3CHK9_BRAOL
MSRGGSPRRRQSSQPVALLDGDRALCPLLSAIRSDIQAVERERGSFIEQRTTISKQVSVTLPSARKSNYLLYLLIFFYPFPFLDMDSTPYAHTANFVELLNSQQDTVFHLVEDSVDPNSSHVPVFGSQSIEASNLGVDKPSERRERRTWSPADDLVLISAWLNTSKDPLVGNEQRSGAF